MAALCFGIAAVPVGAQNIPRIKASVVSFSGSTLIVRPQGEKDPMRIPVRPAPRMMEEQASKLTDIQVGDFIGATLVKNSLGVLSAQEVHIFPAAMQGSGEGLYPAAPNSPRMILDGTVGQINPAGVGVRYRGASGEGPYAGGQGCSGRGPIDPLSGCQGSIIIAVPGNTPVTALVTADKSHVKPGAVLALSIMAGPDGKPATPGFTIESAAPEASDAAAPAAPPLKTPATPTIKTPPGKKPQ